MSVIEEKRISPYTIRRRKTNKVEGQETLNITDQPVVVGNTINPEKVQYLRQMTQILRSPIPPRRKPDSGIAWGGSTMRH